MDKITLLYYANTVFLFILFIVRYTTRTIVGYILDNHLIDWLINLLIAFSGTMAITNTDNITGWYIFIGFLFIFAAIKDYSILRKFRKLKYKVVLKHERAYREKHILNEMVIGGSCIFWSYVIPYIKKNYQNCVVIISGVSIMIYGIISIIIYWREYNLRKKENSKN
ncbi:MAG: hypothetical protein AB1349_09240 [Elusimicrobiota bacterium]